METQKRGACQSNRQRYGLKNLLVLVSLIGMAGCSSPDPLQIAMEQRTVTYVSGESPPSSAPSTIR